MFRRQQEVTRGAVEKGESNKNIEEAVRADGKAKPKRWFDYPQGPNRLAVWTAEDPDRSTTIYRRFNRLNAYNLLHLEAELAIIEEEIETTETAISALLATSEKEASADSAVLALRQLRKDWQFAQLLALGNLPDTTSHRDEIEALARKKVNNVFALRKQMAEYHEALQRSDEVLNLTQPNRRTLKVARQIFGQGAKALMSGSSEKRLRDDQDLCVLSRETKTDPLTKLFEGKFAFLFRSPHGDLVRHQNVDIAVSVISVVLSAAFLLGAVLALFFITNPNAQLGALAGFVGAFALILAMLTNARRHEVFAATAAYAAVLVVFIGADIGSRTSTSSVGGPVSPQERSVSTSVITMLTTVTSTPSATTFSPSPTIFAVSTPIAETSSHSSRLSAGAAAGIGIGSALTGFLVTFVICVIFLRRRQSKRAARDRSNGKA